MLLSECAVGVACCGRRGLFAVGVARAVLDSTAWWADGDAKTTFLFVVCGSGPQVTCLFKGLGSGRLGGPDKQDRSMAWLVPLVGAGGGRRPLALLDVT